MQMNLYVKLQSAVKTEDKHDTCLEPRIPSF